ncbi:MAG TPA: phospho-sugar mutase, partial [Chthoniobacteraceae bacterium]|nr:phospho-sugar mutase [Chthoniobacteraceae bacterium]
MSDDLSTAIRHALDKRQLLESAARNIEQMLARGTSPRIGASVAELVADAEWDELNDRFFKTLAFGTGGLRGRTIGKIVTRAEQGTLRPGRDRPEFPCVGTNAMNEYNVSRATQGLVAYVKGWFAKNAVGASMDRPRLVIAHDTRHFSPEFAQLAARVAMENGCDVSLFDGARSTPELSFAVRQQRAQAGIVLTASHNPPHDNGYKVYFDDGGQVVEPHASGIIAQVNAVESDVYEPLPESMRGRLTRLGREIDDGYMARLQTLILDPELVARARTLRIVFTSIHGTGGTIVKPMLDRLGFQYATVPEQELPDGRFPTVRSPNPENAEALRLAIARADEEEADLVIATDPDADRMGVAARNREGAMELFTGNQIGSLMAFYRVRKLIEQGVITPENASRCVIIKTFVTTDLQKAIAERHGLRCVETLTGFKYIGQKLAQYEAALPPDRRANYRNLSEAETRALRLQYSSFYVCGGEESYGYSAADFVRDKDANGAAVVFCEVAASAKARGLTIDRLLDEIYCEYGFYLEQNGNMTFEGAEGAAKIQRLINSYAETPPKNVQGAAVIALRDFAKETFHDSEGQEIPKEKMLMIELEDGRRVAVRPSGTEPKIKFYMFARRAPAAGGRFRDEEINALRREVKNSLEALWLWLQRDVE